MIAGTLEIQILSNIARLSSDMQKAQSVVGGAMRNVESAVSKAQRALGGLGVGVGFGAMVAGFKSMVDAAAQLDDISERTGAAVAELSKLEQVARIGGHSIEGVEGALIRLSKALHGTDEEAKGAGKALAALGLSADALRNKDTAEALKIVAVELDKYRDGSGKTALALDLLGKSGAQALPFLKDLANEQGVAARVTAEQAAAAEELQKSIGRLKNEFHGFAQSLALEVVPGLNDWIAANKEAIRIAGSAGEALRLFVFNLDAMTTEKPREEIERLTQKLLEFQQASSVGKFILSPTGFIFGGREEDLRKQLELLRFLEKQQALSGAALLGGDTRGEQQRFQLQGAVKPALEYAGAVKTANDATTSLMEQQVKFVEGLVRQAETLGMTQEQLILYDAALRDLPPKLMEVVRWAASRIGQHEAEKQALDQLVRSMEIANAERLEEAQALAAIRKLRDDAIVSFTKEIDQVEFETTLIGKSNAEREIAIALRQLETSEIEKGGIAYEALATRMAAAIRLQHATREQHEKLKDSVTEMGEFAREAARGIQRGLSDGLFDLMEGKFKDMGDRFEQMLKRMAADAAAAKIGKTLFGDFDKTGSVGGLLGGLFGFLSPGTQAPAPVFDLIPKAAGGPVMRGAPYLVGERGPELFIPRSSGNITPNDKLGGTTIHVSNVFHITGQTDQRSQAQIAAAAGRGVARQMSRNTA